MSLELSRTVAEFSPGDVTVRLVGGFFGILPFVATWSPTLNLDSAALAAATRINRPDLAPRIRARAEELAREAGPQAALAAFDFLDKGDKGIALFSGLRSAYKAARGEGEALEMDPQQAADAGLKAVGISWVVWKLFRGSAAEKVQGLTETEAGRALLAWYVAADLVLPFSDNLAAGGASAITSMLSSTAAANTQRLAAVAGGDATEAVGVLNSMMATFEAGIGQAASYAQPLTEYVQAQAPGIFGSADKISGVVATGVDVLASYRLIGGSLVAEVCLTQAAQLVKAKAEAEEADVVRMSAERAEAERAAVEAERAAASARLAASAAQKDYSLDTAVAADSIRNSGVKYTRSAEIEAQAAAPPARAGCMGCGSAVILCAVVASGMLAAVIWT